MECRTAWILSVFAVFAQDSKATLTVVPNNTAVVEGDVAIMKCTTNNDSKLLWRIINESQVNATLITIYTGNKFTNNYTEYFTIGNSTEGQFTLEVKARKKIPLHYICEEAGVQRAGSDLVVLESNPRCEFSGSALKDGRNLYSNVQMWCTIHFAGNWVPVMEWKIVSGEGIPSSVENRSIHINLTNNVVNSTINIVAHPNLNGCKFICTTQFTELSRKSKYNKRPVNSITWPVASNVPEYSFIWTSEILYVVTEDNVSLIYFKKDSSDSRIASVIIILIIATCVLGGAILAIIFTARRRRMYWISKITIKPRTALNIEQNDHIENEVRTSESNVIQIEIVASHQAAAITEADHLPTIPDVVEECGNEQDKQNSSRAAAKLKSKPGYVEMRGIKKRHTQFQGKANVSYVTMDPVNKSNGPPKPPRACRNEQSGDPEKTYRPLTVGAPPSKPPRVSQSDTTEYVDMDVAKAYTTGVASPSRKPMYSRVEVYATIDHKATAPPPISKPS